MPDGRQILVRAQGSDPANNALQGLLVSRFGGAPRRAANPDLALPTVSPDGKQIAGAVGAGASRLRVTAIDGGLVRTVELPGVTSIYAVRWSPSGNQIAIAGRTPEATWAVWTIRPDGSDLRRIHSGNPGTTISSSTPSIEWSRSGDAVYVQWETGGGGEVWRIYGTTGDAPVAKPVLTGIVPSTSLAISADGDRLAQLRTFTTANLWRLDLTGSGSAPTPITQSSGALLRPHVSPDGRAVAAVRGGEVVKVPMEGGDPVPIVRGRNGSWSPDRRHFAFADDRGQGLRVFVGDADGQQSTEVKEAIPGNADVLWLSDGRLAWQTGDAQHYIQNYNILDLTSGQREFLIKKPVGYTIQAAFAPKGDSVALYWNRQPLGLWVVWGAERKERFLAAGLYPAGWSLEGQWIYAYRLGTREIVRVNAGTGKVEPIGGFPVGALSYYSCDLTPDRRAIVCSLEDTKSDVWIVDHFDPQAALPKK
jgi:Tol biopolymer transport system component